VDVRQAAAEDLPFKDGGFDVAVAQLVVHFMTDPVAGIGQMARVTRHGGTVAACVWDHAGSLGPLGRFWKAARDLDPDAVDESDLPGARADHLTELFEAAGLHDVTETTLRADREHPTFDDWWDPFEHGVGPAGAYVATLDADRRTALRDHCRRSLGDGPFTIAARAWAARGTA
jgi:SAM-dependent methyltransferase